MTDENRDPKLLQRYRELGAEEPPRALDDAILAASRRAVESHPAPLVAPAGRRRWYVPLAAAAVMVLAVAVTLQLQLEQPGEQPGQGMVAEKPAKPVEPPAEAVKPKAPPARPQAEKRFVPDPDRAPAPAAPAPALPTPSARSDVGSSAGGLSAPAPARDHAERPAAAMEMRSKRAEAAPAVEGSPEKELERIAQLRREGRHEEADKALAEFRKRNPDYRIPEAMIERVEKR